MTLDPGNSISLLQKCTSEIKSKPYKTVLRTVLLKAEGYHTKSSRHWKYLPCGFQLWFLFLNAPSLKPKKTEAGLTPSQARFSSHHSETSADLDIKQPETTVFYKPFWTLGNIY